MAKFEKTVVGYRCDSCGVEIGDYKSAEVVMRADGDITFEWWPEGDYCGNCLADLLNGIVDAIPVAERYSRKRKPEKVSIELAVIEKWRDKLAEEGA